MRHLASLALLVAALAGCPQRRSAPPRTGGVEAREASRATSCPGGRAVTCRILSLFKLRGQWMLHLQCPDGAAVRPGQVGHLVHCGSERWRSEEMEVRRVQLPHVIVRTTLLQLGCCREVRFCVDGGQARPGALTARGLCGGSGVGFGSGAPPRCFAVP